MSDSHPVKGCLPGDLHSIRAYPRNPRLILLIALFASHDFPISVSSVFHPWLGNPLVPADARPSREICARELWDCMKRLRFNRIQHPHLEPRMNRAACLLVIWSLIPIQSHAEDKPIGELSALEKKLCESWQGTGPCDGRLILHANGTYERQFYGPAGINSQGRWTLRWEELPPALTLHCQKSDDADDVGTSRSWKLVTLNGAALVITQEASQRQTTFKRVAK